VVTDFLVVLVCYLAQGGIGQKRPSFPIWWTNLKSRNNRIITTSLARLDPNRVTQETPWQLQLKTLSKGPATVGQSPSLFLKLLLPNTAVYAIVIIVVLLVDLCMSVPFHLSLISLLLHILCE
jgi:hypothetical protein